MRGWSSEHEKPPKLTFVPRSSCSLSYYLVSFITIRCNHTERDMRIRGRDITACVLAGMVVFTAATAGVPPEPADSSAAVSAAQATVDVVVTLPNGVRCETLLKAGASWDGAPYAGYPSGSPEITVVRLSIPPHTVLPWHSHPMPNAAYVVSGS